MYIFLDFHELRSCYVKLSVSTYFEIVFVNYLYFYLLYILLKFVMQSVDKSFWKDNQFLSLFIINN